MPNDISQTQMDQMLQYKSIFVDRPKTDKINAAIAEAKLEEGSYNAIEVQRTLAYDILVDSIDIIPSTFRLTETDTGITSLYAFVYSKHDKCKDITHLFICTGSSYLSRDGEYKSNFVPFASLDKVKTHKLWDDFMHHMKYYLYRRNLLLTVDHFYPTKQHAACKEALELSVAQRHLAMDLLVLTWLCNLHRHKYKNINKLANPNLGLIMKRYYKEDLETIDTILKTNDLSEDDFLGLFLDATGVKPGIHLGQKLIPLSLSEAQHPFNVQYKSWRELIVSSLASNLVVNNICNAFSLTETWLYMRNIKKGLFENEIQYAKLEKSDMAKEMLNTMLQTYRQSQHIAKEIRHEDHRMQPEDHFTEFGSILKRSIEFGKKELIMSDTVLGMILEHSGKTWCEYVKWSKMHQMDLTKFAQHDTFVRFLFEICYALYCLSEIYGVIHGDLHLNNVSIGNSFVVSQDKYDVWSFGLPSENSKDSKDWMALYLAGDNPDEQFVLPTNGFKACIFDFSRCIIHPDKAIDLQLTSLPRNYAPVDDVVTFTNQQTDHLIRLLVHNAPNYRDREIELKTLFKNNFDSAFKLMTALDIYGLTTRMKSFLEKEHMCKESMTILNRLHMRAEKFIVQDMDDLLVNRNSKKILDMPSPMLQLMKDVFKDYNCLHFKKGTIVDMFVFNFTPVYSLCTYEEYPPTIAQKDKEDQMKQFENKQRRNLSMIEYIAARHKEKYF